MSVQNLLGIGASGLRAATLGVNVASQNATNAATEGYSRRSVVQHPLPGPPRGGNGVRTDGPMRAADRFIERRVLGATGSEAEASARLAALGPVDAALGEDAGLGQALDALQASLESLSARPADGPTRTEVLASAEGLAAAFRRTSQALASARVEADLRVEQDVSRVNSLSSEIDALQRAIVTSEVSGDEASDLRDQRDQRVRDLAAIVPIHTVEGPLGSLSVVLAGGISLVRAEGGSSELGTSPDPTTGAMRVVRDAAGAQEDITARIHGGSLGGLLAARDGGIANAIRGLDQLAYDVATAYSAAHAAGFGLDGVGARALFDAGAGVTGAALAFSVSSDVAGQPDRLAAATDPTLVAGDNRIALSLTALSTATFATGGQTATGALARLMSQAGQASADASRDQTLLSAAVSQAQAVRESITGVSSDDEMVALMQFQRAFEASLKVVQTADEMLQELLAMKR